jgi:hypothetical protein
MTDSEEESTAFSKSLPRAVCPSNLCMISTLMNTSVILVGPVRYVATRLHLALIVKLLEWHVNSQVEVMT